MEAKYANRKRFAKAARVRLSKRRSTTAATADPLANFTIAADADDGWVEFHEFPLRISSFYQ